MEEKMRKLAILILVMLMVVGGCVNSDKITPSDLSSQPLPSSDSVGGCGLSQSEDSGTKIIKINGGF